MSETIEIADYWCPAEQRWVMCPGPCPDGTEHIEKRTRTLQAHTARTPR